MTRQPVECSHAKTLRRKDSQSFYYSLFPNPKPEPKGITRMLKAGQGGNLTIPILSSPFPLFFSSFEVVPKVLLKKREAS
jgi:hypothetical protein